MRVIIIWLYMGKGCKRFLQKVLFFTPHVPPLRKTSPGWKEGDELGNQSYDISAECHKLWALLEDSTVCRWETTEILRGKGRRDTVLVVSETKPQSSWWCFSGNRTTNFWLAVFKLSWIHVRKSISGKMKLLEKLGLLCFLLYNIATFLFGLLVSLVIYGQYPSVPLQSCCPSTYRTVWVRFRFKH